MTSNMTPKQRLLAAIQGKSVDRTPWSPFLAYWWENQSPEKTQQGQLAFMESVGADPLLRGFGAPWVREFRGVTIRSNTIGREQADEWETPVGTLRFLTRYSEAGNTWFLTGHPVATVEDLKILQWIYEHAEIRPDGGADSFHVETGERGLYVPLIGCEMKTCFQSMVERWVGTENLVYLLADEPEAVEECLAAMQYASDKTIPLCASSEAESFIFWEDSSTNNISPDMFRRYSAPEIARWANHLHSAGKLLIHHACGSLKDLLVPMAETGIDAIESISPPPTGNIDIAQAFDKLPEHVALIGGIEPVFYQNCTGEELDQRVRHLLEISKERRFILANSDSCPPGVAEWKFRFVTDLTARYGQR